MLFHNDKLHSTNILCIVTSLLRDLRIFTALTIKLRSGECRLVCWWSVTGISEELAASVFILRRVSNFFQEIHTPSTIVQMEAKGSSSTSVSNHQSTWHQVAGYIFYTLHINQLYSNTTVWTVTKLNTWVWCKLQGSYVLCRNKLGVRWMPGIILFVNLKISREYYINAYKRMYLMYGVSYAVVMHSKSHTCLVTKKEDNVPTYLLYYKITFIIISSLAVLLCSFLVTWLNPCIKNVEVMPKNKTKKSNSKVLTVICLKL